MGWHGNSIRHGSGQQHGLGHGDRRGSCDKFNGDDHDDQSRHRRWFGHSHGDVTGCCIDSNVWGNDINGYWFHCSDQ